MYDNPTVETIEYRQAVKFRKIITKMGFLALQKSVYVKLIYKRAHTRRLVDQLIQNAPENGDVKMLVIPLKNYKNLFNIKGKDFDMKLFADDIITI